MNLVQRIESDRGDTLVEILVTVVILGAGIVAIVGGVATSIFMTTLHRQQATEQTLLRSYADAVIVAQNWSSCDPTTTRFQPGSGPGTIGWVVPASYGGSFVASATGAVTFFNGTNFLSSCPSNSAPQLVHLQVSASRATEKMDVVVRCEGILSSAGGPCP